MITISNNEDKFENSTVVYVTDQFSCENLIKAGRLLADETKTNLYVVNVSTNDFQEQLPNMEALEFLYQTSRKHSAVMNVFYETDVGEILRKTARNYSAQNIITGMPQKKNSVLTDFWRVDDDVKFYVVDDEVGIKEIDYLTKEMITTELKFSPVHN